MRHKLDKLQELVHTHVTMTKTQEQQKQEYNRAS
uniref:Uncharacterized protein n=1 Tax=Anguilla anguilla TaxID=7936 RepID=A0A0E9Q6J9_ANGAN